MSDIDAAATLAKFCGTERSKEKENKQNKGNGNVVV